MRASGSLGPPRAVLVLTRPTLANSRPRLHGPPCPINVAAEAAVAVADPAAAAALQVYLRPGVLPPRLGADAARSLPLGLAA